MKLWKRLLAGVLSSAFVFGVCPAMSIFAEETAPSVEMKFTGDEANLAGFAQSKITVTPGSKTASSGYFLIYYTDSTRVLPDYDEALFIAIDGKNSVTGSISDGRMLPQGASGIAVFESDAHFMEETPDPVIVPDFEYCVKCYRELCAISEGYGVTLLTETNGFLANSGVCRRFMELKQKAK